MTTQLQARKDELADVLADPELGQDEQLVTELQQQIEYLEAGGDEETTQDLYLAHSKPRRHPMQGAADALEATLAKDNAEALGKSLGSITPIKNEIN